MSSFSDISDQDLLCACISGDRKAAETFVRRFSSLIYATIQQTLICKQMPYIYDDLQDFHNTVFAELFDRNCRKLSQYQGKNGCSPATWIRTVTVRTLLNHLRKKGADSMAGRKQMTCLDQIANLSSQDDNQLKIIEKSDQIRILNKALKKLPSRERLFLKLHIQQDLPISEVAEILKISVKNAYTVKHRAVQKLKTLVMAVNQK